MLNSKYLNLIKTLVQIVGSLQELISKKAPTQTNLQPAPPKLKKTPQMTYIQFVRKALANAKPAQSSSKNSSFKLHQDLELLSELSNYSQISNKNFQQISKSKKLGRSAELLKSRYNDYLYRIDENEMKKIVSWIEQEGIEGYITWDENQLKIQQNDPKDNKRSRPENIKAEGKKTDKVSKKSKNVPVNCKQLNEVLKLYSKMVNIPVKSLAEKLDQLSGDLVQLDNYIETKDSRLLWTPQEDEILRKGGLQLEILRRYRGGDVEVRRRYLGL